MEEEEKVEKGRGRSRDHRKGSGVIGEGDREKR